MGLVVAARGGDEQACVSIIKRYRGLVASKARLYFLAGADREDVVQEGMIGLFKAIRDFDPGRQASFHSFAEICVTRQIISAVKMATRRKHAPLNGYVSLSHASFDDEGGERILEDILAARGITDPAQIVIGAWEARSIKDGMNEALSPLEADVLRLYTRGCSYQEIAFRLGRHTKAVDNAIQRVKRKMEMQLRAVNAH